MSNKPIGRNDGSYDTCYLMRLMEMVSTSYFRNGIESRCGQSSVTNCYFMRTTFLLNSKAIHWHLNERLEVRLMASRPCRSKSFFFFNSFPLLYLKYSSIDCKNRFYSLKYAFVWLELKCFLNWTKEVCVSQVVAKRMRTSVFRSIKYLFKIRTIIFLRNKNKSNSL